MSGEGRNTTAEINVKAVRLANYIPARLYWYPVDEVGIAVREAEFYFGFFLEDTKPERRDDVKKRTLEYLVDRVGSQESERREFAIPFLTMLLEKYRSLFDDDDYAVMDSKLQT